MTRHLNLLDNEARMTISLKITDGDGHRHVLDTQSGDAVQVQAGDTIELPRVALSEAQLLIDSDDVVTVVHGGDQLLLRGLYETLEAEHDISIRFSDAAEGGVVENLGDLLARTSSDLGASALSAEEIPALADGDLLWIAAVDDMAPAGEGVHLADTDMLNVGDVLQMGSDQPDSIEGALSGLNEAASGSGGDLSGYLSALGGGPSHLARGEEIPVSAAVLDHALQSTGEPIFSGEAMVGTYDILESDGLTDTIDGFFLI